ncbi:MAG TPA: GGDEF domain-containing protein [Clostridiaceae bacterium]|nr:GGDEF domain-containing protein [Clostridiaceae bacterium]
MADIDHFKNVNDTYGHYVGDRVIKKIGEVMTKYIRKDTDWIARYGGDEFLICLHDVDQKEAYKIVERLRKALESTLVEVEGESIKVTASFGLITVKNTKLKPDDLIKMADDKLYQAKRQGRNRVVI